MIRPLLSKIDTYIYKRHKQSGQLLFDRIDESHRLPFSGGMITPEQCRAARGLLDWTQGDLAREAAVGIVTVRQIESGLSAPRRATLDVVRRALERGGVVFIDANGDGPGVRLRKISLGREV
jgi:hypothetical protein